MIDTAEDRPPKTINIILATVSTTDMEATKYSSHRIYDIKIKACPNENKISLIVKGIALRTILVNKLTLILIIPFKSKLKKCLFRYKIIKYIAISTSRAIIVAIAAP